MSKQLSVPKLSQKFQGSVLLNAEIAQKYRLLCRIVGSSHIGMDSDQQVYVCCQFFGRKYQFFIWAAKYFSQELIYCQLSQSVCGMSVGINSQLSPVDEG